MSQSTKNNKKHVKMPGSVRHQGCLKRIEELGYMKIGCQNTGRALRDEKGNQGMSH